MGHSKMIHFYFQALIHKEERECAGRGAAGFAGRAVWTDVKGLKC